MTRHFLHSVSLDPGKVEDWDTHPFSVPAIRSLKTLELHPKVTFFVGENGSGKSTLLEAIAEKLGFRCSGGSRVESMIKHQYASPLTPALTIARTGNRPMDGFFLRAESFYNFATYIEGVSDLRAYGGKSLHEQSHGESFISLFAHRFEQGLYILDEPEAALSPQRQLSFLKIIHDLSTPGHAQFLIATHSPIILSYPGAELFSLDGDTIRAINYRDTQHFLITRDFLNSPERFFKHLFGSDDADDRDA